MIQRVIDNVPHVIDQSFLRNVGTIIDATMQSHLGLDGVEATLKAADYLAEGAEVAAERNDLTIRKEKLERIVRKLSEIQ